MATSGCSEIPFVLKLHVCVCVLFMCVYTHMCAYRVHTYTHQLSAGKSRFTGLGVNTASQSTALAGLKSEDFLFCRIAAPDIFG